MQPTTSSVWFKPVMITATVMSYDDKPINYVRLEDVFSFVPKCEQKILAMKTSLVDMDRQFHEQFMINEQIKMDTMLGMQQCMQEVQGKRAFCIDKYDILEKELSERQMTMNIMIKSIATQQQQVDISVQNQVDHYIIGGEMSDFQEFRHQKRQSVDQCSSSSRKRHSRRSNDLTEDGK